MIRAIITICFITLLAFVCQNTQAAEDKFFYSDGNIMPGEQWNNVFIYNDSTVVNMSGGTVDSIGTNNASKLNISDGHVNTLNTFSTSSINISGGYVYSLFAEDESTVTLSGVGSGMSFGVYDWATLNIIGGVLEGLGSVGHGTLNISGGVVNDSLGAHDLSTVNIFGHNLFKEYTGGTYGYGRVYGYWEDWTPFNINLNGSETYSRIDLIPEPISLILLGFGALALRRKG